MTEQVDVNTENQKSDKLSKIFHFRIFNIYEDCFYKTPKNKSKKNEVHQSYFQTELKET